MFQVQSRKKVYIGDAPTPWNLDGEWRTLSKECRQYFKENQERARDQEREVRLVNTKTDPNKAMYWGGNGTLPVRDWSQPRE